MFILGVLALRLLFIISIFFINFPWRHDHLFHSDLPCNILKDKFALSKLSQGKIVWKSLLFIVVEKMSFSNDILNHVANDITTIQQISSSIIELVHCLQLYSHNMAVAFVYKTMTVQKQFLRTFLSTTPK